MFRTHGEFEERTGPTTADLDGLSQGDFKFEVSSDFCIDIGSSGKENEKAECRFSSADETLPGQRKDVFIHVTPLKITRHENLKLCKRRLVKAKVG